MVYGAALEKRWVAMPRGFESHPLRQTSTREDIRKYIGTDTKEGIIRCFSEYVSSVKAVFYQRWY